MRRERNHHGSWKWGRGASICPALAAIAMLLFGVMAPAAERSPSVQKLDASFANEVQGCIDRGLAWLRTNQDKAGWWSESGQPAITALVLTAFKGEPAGRYSKTEPPWLAKGYSYLTSCVQPDGGIHQSNLVTYNTALSMMALLAANKPGYDETIRKARQFLVGLQRDFGEKGRMDDVQDGGIGYGSKYEHSDMGNTLAALEALHHSKHLVRDKNPADAPDLNWAAAIHFLENCQNLRAYNTQSWASDDPKNKGGFVYYPGMSMAGSETNVETGRVALRSYGSISYGGMLSYIYADLKRDDPRVTAVFDWLRAHYSIDENPGMGAQGLYFYLHTMTKALNTYGVQELQLKDGRKIDWRKEVALKLLNLQQRDGSWNNNNGRWREKDAPLVTAYAVLSLEVIWRGL